MADTETSWLVETDWLDRHMELPDLVIFDGSAHLPTTGRDGYQEYLQEHIPGALFFDINKIAADDTDLPHMLPSSVRFSSVMRQMGVGDGMRIVVYDSEGIMSAPRVWWTFRVMGAKDVYVLNGGLKKWKAEGRPVGTGDEAPRAPRHFAVRMNPELVSDKQEIKDAINDPSTQILDARSAARFSGQEGEPRPFLRKGHMPGACNLPFVKLVNGDGTLKTKDEIRALFEEAGIDLTKPVITTCGSGVTAAVLALALAEIGIETFSVYDGSWAEWGPETSADGTDVATEMPVVQG